MGRDKNLDEHRRRRLLLAGEVLQHPQLPRLLALLTKRRQYAKLPSVIAEAVARAVLEGSPGFAGCAGARADMLAGRIHLSSNFMLERTANTALKHAAHPSDLYELLHGRRLSGLVGDSVSNVSPAAGATPASASRAAAPGSSPAPAAAPAGRRCWT
jgi:hypothetical protein